MTTEALKGQQKAEERLTLYEKLSDKINALDQRMQELELNCLTFGEVCQEVKLVHMSVEKLVQLESEGRIAEKL